MRGVRKEKSQEETHTILKEEPDVWPVQICGQSDIACHSDGPLHGYLPTNKMHIHTMSCTMLYIYNVHYTLYKMCTRTCIVQCTSSNFTEGRVGGIKAPFKEIFNSL